MPWQRYGSKGQIGAGLSWSQGSAPWQQAMAGRDFQSQMQGPGYEKLLALMGQVGQGANQFRQAGQPSYQFYNQQMNSQDPMGLLANLEGFARKQYGQSAAGVHQGVNQAMRQYGESKGGLQAGGVNPAADRYAGIMAGVGRAGALGNMWGQLSTAEQQMRQQALESTGMYRKGMADSISEWARSMAGATQQDESMQIGAAGQAAGLETQQGQIGINAMLSMLTPFLRYGSWQQPGMSKNQVEQFLRALLGGA